MSRRTRVLLADDHTLVRAGIRALLETIAGVEVVAEADDGHATLKLIEKHQPDVALLDISMPGLNGLEVMRRVASQSPRTRIIVLSMYADATYVRQALAAGAAGYLLKGGSVMELPLALEAVTKGDTYLTAKISAQVVEGFLQGDKADRDPLAALTPRQREILQLLAEGRSNREIARLLEVSVKTVETHRARLMSALDIRDLPGLIRYAIRHGLISAEE